MSYNNFFTAKLMISRLYHVSSVAHNMKKQGLKLNKMLNPRSKRRFYPNSQSEMEFMPSIKSLTKIKHEPGKQGVRRLAMLNKLFMKHITDLMSTGTAEMGIVGQGIEISKVNVAPDLKTVSVYWVCKGNTTDEETESLLNKVAGPLRHELSTLRVMGEVPYIVFVKDKHEAQLVDLDRRLAIADYGEDYTPTEIGHLLKTEFTLATKLSPEMRAKIKQLDGKIELSEEPIPEMSNSVFGLDHGKIMSRLLAARKRSRDAWLGLDADTPPVISYRAPAQPAAVDILKQSKELAEFLKKRQILQEKLRKQEKRSLQEGALYLDDIDDDTKKEDINEEVSDDEEDDYDYETQENYYTGLAPGRLMLAEDTKS